MQTLVVVAALLLVAPISWARDAAPDEVIRKAVEHRLRGDHDRALEELLALDEKHPGDARILLELARTTYSQAMEILGSESPTLGRLALLDSVAWCRKTLDVDPENLGALRLLGAAAVNGGDHRQGALAYRRIVALRPGDGESRYWHGYCLAYLGRFAEAIEVFEAASRLLGPDPRILLNRGICHESLGDKAEARKWYVMLIDAEIEAGRPESPAIRSGWRKLWRLHSSDRSFAAAEEVFAALAKRHPQISGASWYLAHARREQGKAAGAAEAFARVTEIAPGFAEGWRLLGECRVRSGDFADAERALVKLLELGGEGPRDLLLALARGLDGAGRRAEALALLSRMQSAFPDDPSVLETRGDLHFREGEHAAAIGFYRRALAGDPFADTLPVKVQKAVTAILRDGGRAEAEAAVRPEPEPVTPAAGGRSIFDFERPSVLVRVNGRAKGRREEWRFVLRRTGETGRMANLSLNFIPTLDSRSFTSIRFDVRGPAGTFLLLLAKDCYDQFEMRPRFVRLLHEQPVSLTGEWQTVTLPLDGFRSAISRRPIPTNRARIRSFVFEIGRSPGEAPGLAPEIALDDIYLVRRNDTRRLVADFDQAPAETLFLSDGAATPFAPTLSTPAQVESFRPDANTAVTPAILGDAYDPSTVHGGKGAYRLVLAGTGPASGVLGFNPDRAFDQARAITFWARGDAGGERLRVTIRDALDGDLGNPRPASAPRLEENGRLAEGRFLLSSKWRRFRISRADFPDVHFSSLTEIRFRFGTDEGNERGATIYLDDVAWE